MSDDGRITLEKRGHVLLMGIDRVGKRNAFSVAMYRELGRAYGQLQDDPDLRAGVLFAHGDHFTGGLDLAEFAAEFQSGRLPVDEGAIDPMRLQGRALDKPVVCAVQGICFTVGLELMLATDVRVAADDVRFGQIEVRRGIYPVGGATLRFVLEGGWGNAMRWLLTADEFNATEAHRCGFVQEVTPAARSSRVPSPSQSASPSRPPWGSPPSCDPAASCSSTATAPPPTPCCPTSSPSCPATTCRRG